jgi:hypothetical protein
MHTRKALYLADVWYIPEALIAIRAVIIPEAISRFSLKLYAQYRRFTYEAESFGVTIFYYYSAYYLT